MNYKQDIYLTKGEYWELKMWYKFCTQLVQNSKDRVQKHFLKKEHIYILAVVVTKLLQ